MPTVSSRRLAANRANAARSTGPRTPEGKVRAAQNSRKHGFTAANFAVIRLEEQDAVARLKDDLVDFYQPVNSQELFAIERIALAQQALLRSAALETGIFTSCLNEVLNRDDSLALPLSGDLTCDIEVAKAQNRAYALGEGLYLQARKSAGFALFLRYQAQTERLYRRAVEDFDRLKALRGNLPNEPIVEPEPAPAPPCGADFQPAAGLQPAPSPLPKRALPPSVASPATSHCATRHSLPAPALRGADWQSAAEWHSALSPVRKSAQRRFPASPGRPPRTTQHTFPPPALSAAGLQPARRAQLARAAHQAAAAPTRHRAPRRAQPARKSPRFTAHPSPFATRFARATGC